MPTCTALRSHWHCSRDRHVVYGLQRLTDSQPSRPYTFTLPLLTFDPLTLASQVVELWNRSRCFEPRAFVFAAISRGAVAVRSLAYALLSSRHLSLAPSLSYHRFRTIALAYHRSLAPSLSRTIKESCVVEVYSVLSCLL